ncbi:MAG: hypothetical protein B7733_23395 [Myxococcales bacterium FL481]|nr:MAG: hypothetical protein B7733_23395 [Myxococcales bacterium FL481]
MGNARGSYGSGGEVASSLLETWRQRVEEGLVCFGESMGLTAGVATHSAWGVREDCGGAYMTLNSESHTLMIGFLGTVSEQRALAMAFADLELGDEEPDREMMDDTLGELLNVVVGHAKQHVPALEAGLEIGVPMFVRGRLGTRGTVGKTVLDAEFGGAAFQVVMLLFPLAHTAAQRRDEIRRRKRLEEELRIAQRLEAVGQLAAGIAHEINTPMQFLGDNIEFLGTAIEDLLELVTKAEHLHAELKGVHAEAPSLRAFQVASEEAELDYLREQTPVSIEHCGEGVRRISNIVAAMKDFGRPDRQDTEPADINRIVENTLVVSANEYKMVAKSRTNLGPVPTILCYPSQLSQVLLNLVVNAAHAIADRRGAGEELGLIEVSTACDGAGVCITVRDTGGGIPEDVQHRIFEPFFTTKEVGKGTGQGLAIARSIVVDKHGGRIDFEVEPGVGTQFRVWLPMETSEAAA